MSSSVRYFLVLAIFLFCCQNASGREKSDLLFTENLGQIADAAGHPRPDILATAYSRGANVFIAGNAIHYQFLRMIYPEGNKPGNTCSTQIHRFSLSLEGAKASPRVRKEARSAYTENFYLAHCPKGITGVPTYGRIVLEDVYPGIDWVIYGHGQGLKYDFIIHPGADPSRVRLRIRDADAEITADGGMLISTSLGTLKEERPVSFSEDRQIPTAFRREAPGLFGFLPADYDNRKTLVIDPSVTWSSYFGANASGGEEGGASTTDAAGNLYLTGQTTATTGISASGGFQQVAGGNWDALIVKFNRNGIRLWGSYYGGTGNELATSCAIDPSGYLYVTGNIESPGMASTSAHQSGYGGGTDAFLLKSDLLGAMQWSTYYGGSGADNANGCRTDGQGNVYICGVTVSGSGIATGGAHQPAPGNTTASDGFLAKFNSSGARQWGTYYGGTGQDNAYSCATDATGNVVICGSTTSIGGIAYTGMHQSTFGGTTDGFLVRFNSAGIRQWSTYYGGTGHDAAIACAADAAGNVFVGGQSLSFSGIASSGAFQSASGGGTDAFLAKFDSSGIRSWGTYYGRTGTEGIASMTLGPNGDIYIAGVTSSTGLSTPDAFQFDFGGFNDAFIASFSNGGARQWTSYLGGTSGENARSCSVDSNAVYISGNTSSATNIATPGAFDTSYDGPKDLFMTRIVPEVITPDSIIGSPFCAGDTINVSFLATGTFGSGNVFTAQLSYPGRTFAAPIELGTLPGNGATGVIRCIIPDTMKLNNTYRVRIVSSDPLIAIGRNNNKDLTIRARPPAAVLSYSGGLISSSITSGTRWFGPNGFISGNNNKASYRPAMPGNYYVEITSSNGCKARSNIIQITQAMLGVDAALLSGLVEIFPNPASAELTIGLPAGSGRISLISFSGSVLMDGVPLQAGKNKLVLPECAPGIYFLRIQHHQGPVTHHKITISAAVQEKR